jgi:hypothetical protein
VARRSLRRGAWIALATALPAVVIPVSCGFPEVEFRDRNEGGSGEGGSSESSTDGPSGDAAIVEGSVRDDSTARVPDGTCVPTDCDCDKDLFRSDKCDAAGTPDGTKFDCDDLDPLRKPDARLTGEVPPQGQVPYGDWNCDGKPETAYETNIKCAYALTTCTGGSGYKNNPPCGTAADYFECRDLGALTGGCAAVKLDSRTQLCK